MLRALLAARLALYAKGKESAYDLALAYALLNDRKALDYLAISLSRQEPEIASMKINPLFAPFHGSPEFQRLLIRSGLQGGA